MAWDLNKTRPIPDPPQRNESVDRAVIHTVVLRMGGENQFAKVTIDEGVSDGVSGGELRRRLSSKAMHLENVEDDPANQHIDDILDTEITGETLRTFLNRVLFVKAQDKGKVTAGTRS